MISVEDARTRILGRLRPVSTEIVGLSEAWGRVLAQDLAARRTQPPFAASSMDGYAVRGSDIATIPARLTCIGESKAGAGFGGAVGPFEAVRLFTGAPVPTDADTVVIQENAHLEGASVTVNEATALGDNIRAAGCDFTAGTVGLTKGARLSARAIGLAAAMNHPWIPVYRQPRIAILPTGDEVALPGEPIGPDQIIDANGPAIAALVRASGGIPILRSVVRDDPSALLDAIKATTDCDMLVTIGGASVGDHDLVAKMLHQPGMDLDFWKIAMRPGKPLLFGAFGALPVLGLPGNPISAMVTAMIFLRPAIETLQGMSVTADELDMAVTTVGLPMNGVRQDYMRGVAERGPDGVLRVTPLSAQDSSLTLTLAAATCLIVRPPHAEPAPSGSTVPIMRLGLT